MIYIGICGDDAAERKYVKCLLIQCAERKNLVCRIDSYANGRSLLQENKSYDILFVSVSTTGVDGVELGRILRQKNKWVKVIYIIDPLEPPFRMHHVRVFDYLVRPFSGKDFFEKFAEMVDYLYIEQKKMKISFQTNVDFFCFMPEEIYYIEAIPSHRIRIVTTRGVYSIRGTVRKTLIQIKSYGFERPHKGFIVNLAHIVRIERYTIFLANGDKVVLAEKRAKFFKSALQVFLGKFIEKK